MGYVENIIGWISYAADIFSKVIINAFPGQKIGYEFAGYQYREQLEKTWNALPQSERDKPEIKAQYDEVRKQLGSYNTDLIAPARKAAEDAAKWMTETYMDIPVTTPETAVATATALVIADAMKDVSIGMLSLAAETASAGQIETTTDFFKFMRAKTGYGGPMTLLMKSPIELGLIAPLSFALHAKYRDAYLSSRDALALSTKGYVTDDQMTKAFQYEGLPDWAIKAKTDDRWRELRLGEIAWALNDALADDKWLNDKLKYALYSPEDRPIIIRMIQEKYLRTYRDRVASQIKNLYKEGYINKETFDSRLITLKIPPTVIKMLASEADYLYHIDLNTDLITTWITAYKNDIINENVLRGNLSTIIVDPARVEAQINKAKASRKPEAVAPPKPSTQGIRISSKPTNAYLILDGTDTERITPETLEMTAARHTLIVGSEGYEETEYAVDIASGQFVEIYAVLTPIQTPGAGQ